MSFEEHVKTAAKATVIIRQTNDPCKESSFCSGFVVGQCSNLCIIMSVGHFYTPDSGLEVIFYGHEDAVFGATVQVFIPESEILILTVEKRDDIETGKLTFESADNWELRYFQLLASVSHPCSLRWKAALGIINCPAFLNSSIRKYDSKMVMFDHSLQFGNGSSGAALINERGNVAGIQSGQIASTYLTMSGQPVLDALAKKKSQTVDLPFQLIAMYISDLVFEYQQLHTITTILCGLKQAVHIKYIDEVLRSLIQKEFNTDVSKISLNDLIEQYISTISSVGYVKRAIRPSRKSSSRPYLVGRPSQPTYSRTSQLRCSHRSRFDTFSNIVESWKMAYAAYESGRKEKSSENKAGWKAGEGGLTGEHFFGSNQDRYPPDKNGSNPQVSELFKEVMYSKKSNAEKRMQYDNAGFKVKVFTQPHYLHNFVQSAFNALSADKVRGIGSLSELSLQILYSAFFLGLVCYLLHQCWQWVAKVVPETPGQLIP